MSTSSNTSVCVATTFVFLSLAGDLAAAFSVSSDGSEATSFSSDGSAEISFSSDGSEATSFSSDGSAEISFSSDGSEATSFLEYYFESFSSVVFVRISSMIVLPAFCRTTHKAENTWNIVW